MRYRFISILLLLSILLSGCGNRQDESPPSADEEQVSAPEPEVEPDPEPYPVVVDAPKAELWEEGEITVYIIEPDSDIYTPHPADVPRDATLLDILWAVEDCLDVRIPALSITQQKGMVVIDLQGRFIDDNSKEKVYEALTALAMTLQQNHRSFEWIQFQVEGETGTFGEAYEFPPLKLMEADAEEFAAIRRQIPYEGLDYYPVEQHILETDETGRRLADYLSLLYLDSHEITGIGDIDNESILSTAIYVTKYYTTYPDDQNYRPELKPFEAAATELLDFVEQQFWMKEHVEESIRLLYGEEAAYTHGDFDKFRYLETLGVYTPPHMGGGRGVLPAILGYEDLGDRIEAEVAYVSHSMGGYMTPETWEPIPESGLRDYVLNAADRYTVVVKKVGDDWFLLESQTRQ